MALHSKERFRVLIYWVKTCVLRFTILLRFPFCHSNLVKVGHKLTGNLNLFQTQIQYMNSYPYESTLSQPIHIAALLFCQTLLINLSYTTFTHFRNKRVLEVDGNGVS